MGDWVDGGWWFMLNIRNGLVESFNKNYDCPEVGYCVQPLIC